MKKFYLFLFVLVAGILVSTVFFLYLWNKPKKDISALSPDYKLSVETLVEDFKKDTLAANEKYNGMILLLKGKVTWFEEDRQGNMHIFFQENEIVVQCTLRKGWDTRNPIKDGDEITIKGKYTGLEQLLGLTIKLNNCYIEDR